MYRTLFLLGSVITHLIATTVIGDDLEPLVQVANPSNKKIEARPKSRNTPSFLHRSDSMQSLSLDLRNRSIARRSRSPPTIATANLKLKPDERPFFAETIANPSVAFQSAKVAAGKTIDSVKPVLARRTPNLALGGNGRLRRTTDISQFHETVASTTPLTGMVRPVPTQSDSAALLSNRTLSHQDIGVQQWLQNSKQLELLSRLEPISDTARFSETTIESLTRR